MALHFIFWQLLDDGHKSAEIFGTIISVIYQNIIDISPKSIDISPKLGYNIVEVF